MEHDTIILNIQRVAMNDGNNNLWRNFFHGVLSERDARERILAVNINGCYIARKSPTNKLEIIISYLHGGIVKHFIIPKKLFTISAYPL